MTDVIVYLSFARHAEKNIQQKDRQVINWQYSGKSGRFEPLLVVVGVRLLSHKLEL